MRVGRRLDCRELRKGHSTGVQGGLASRGLREGLTESWWIWSAEEWV